MKNIITSNYFYKIKAVVHTDEFYSIEKIISTEKNERLEAFWNIIVAGYSAKFALSNYRMLYDYIKDKPINYPEALVTYVTYPGVESGIYLEKTKWFELN